MWREQQQFSVIQSCVLKILLSFWGLFRANLCIVKELGDRAAQGRTYGNLGNTYYLLGNFRDAVASHEQVNEMVVTDYRVWMYHSKI